MNEVIFLKIGDNFIVFVDKIKRKSLKTFQNVVKHSKC